MNLLKLAFEVIKTNFKIGYEGIDHLNKDNISEEHIQKRLDDLRNMDSDEFEEIAAQLYRERGYEVRLTKKGADGGIDVIAESEDMTVAIQAKRYSLANTVGAKTVRETFAATRREKILRPSIITTSKFTRNARKEADQLGVELIDGEDLARELIKNTRDSIL